MTPEERMLIEGISSRLDAIESRQDTVRKENNDAHRQIYDRLNEISVNGCAKGREHEKSLADLRAAPGKIVSVISALVSATAAALALAWRHN